MTPLAPTIFAIQHDENLSKTAPSSVEKPFVLFLGNLELRTGLVVLLNTWGIAKLSKNFTLKIVGGIAYLSDTSLTHINDM